MKLISFLLNNKEQLGFIVNETVYYSKPTASNFPKNMQEMLAEWDDFFPIIQSNIEKQNFTDFDSILLIDAKILAPVPRPPSCRDGYAFRQHVAAARRNRKVEMIPEFDQYPIFYFTNHNSIQGPGDVLCMPDHFNKLDFELEAAIVIKKKGRNIKAANADEYIAGLMIMNDMSARTLQMEEMKLNLGPAKGKDFSTVIGPWLVTLEELKQFEASPKPNHIGKAWNLTMTCNVNGIEVSRGNVADMDWTFAEIIERASYGVDIYPGDVIGSGTVGTGCFLELNGTGKLNDSNYQEQWLQSGDVVEMAIDGLGVLTNKMVAEDTDWSILAQKKNI